MWHSGQDWRCWRIHCGRKWKVNFRNKKNHDLETARRTFVMRRSKPVNVDFSFLAIFMPVSIYFFIFFPCVFTFYTYFTYLSWRSSVYFCFVNSKQLKTFIRLTAPSAIRSQSLLFTGLPKNLFQRMASCYGDGEGPGGAVCQGLRGREGLGHILPIRWTQRWEGTSGQLRRYYIDYQLQSEDWDGDFLWRKLPTGNRLLWIRWRTSGTETEHQF